MSLYYNWSLRENEDDMLDPREGFRQLQEQLHELEGVIEADSVSSITLIRTNSPTPMFVLYAYTEHRTRGPYTVSLDDVVRVLQRAGLEISVSPDTLDPGAIVRYDRKR